MKCLLTLLSILSCISNIRAQERIDTDRPDQTESAVTVPLHYFQAELGFNREDYKDGTLQWVHPTGLFKYGFHKRAELRLEAGIITVQNPDTTDASGFELLSIGTKIALWGREGPTSQDIADYLSRVALLIRKGVSHARILAIGNAQATTYTFQSCSTWIQRGRQLYGVENVPTWFYTFSPSINIGKRWYAYVDASRFLHQGSLPEHNFDAGIAYYISNDLKLDASGGFGIATSTLKNYVALGCAFRFRAIKDKAVRSSSSTGSE